LALVRSTVSRNSGGTLASETRLVPRSGAVPSVSPARSSTSYWGGLPARAASDATIVSTTLAGDAALVPDAAAAEMR